MRGLLHLLIVAVLAVPGLAEEPPGAKESGQPSWIGKHRDEVVAKWGPPAKTKARRGGGEVLIYELMAYERDAYAGSGGEYEAEASFTKDDEGKYKPDVVAEGPPPQPVYKKMKFKFVLDGDGRVIEIDFPKKAKFYIPPAGAAPPPTVQPDTID